jgi:hypothetical protein
MSPQLFEKSYRGQDKYKYKDRNHGKYHRTNLFGYFRYKIEYRDQEPCQQYDDQIDGDNDRCINCRQLLKYQPFFDDEYIG